MIDGRLARPEGTPGLVAAGCVGVAMTATYSICGHFAPGHDADPTSSPRAITGMALMLTGTCTYIPAAWTLGQRRSLALLDELRGLLPDPTAADRAAAAIRGAWRRTWPVGTAFGLLLALFNTNPITALTRAPDPRIAFPISLGQLLLWWLIGMLVLARFDAARAFGRLSSQVRFDLFRLDGIRPLARAGVVDAAIVMGALLFAPLQSLDLHFRWENYRFALAVALPALAFYLAWPLWSVHRRILADRVNRIACVDAELEPLAGAPPESAEETERLERLLAHRDRLLTTRTWPLDLRVLSRVVFYLIIPPLAWAAAAVVERLVDSVLARV